MKLKKTNSKKEKAKSSSEGNTIAEGKQTSSKHSLTNDDDEPAEEENIDYEDFSPDEDPEDDEDT